MYAYNALATFARIAERGIIMGEYLVYVHTVPNGKKYVGITKQDKERRWLRGAGYEHQPKFYKAIQEYGWRNILHEVIAENLTEQEARQMEKEYISKFGCYDMNGYNTRSGGKDKFINIRCTEEERKEWSELAKSYDMTVADFLRYLVAKERKEREK